MDVAAGDVLEQPTPQFRGMGLQLDVGTVAGVQGDREVVVVDGDGNVVDLGGVRTVEPDREAEDRRECPDELAVGPAQAGPLGVLLLRRRLAVVAGDLGDELDLASSGRRSSCACGVRSAR